MDRGGAPSDRAILASSSRSRRPRTRRRRADDGGRHRRELGQHPHSILVSHGAKNKGGIRPAGLPQVVRQCAGASRVVRCVEQELMRSVAEQFEPRWPLDVLDRVAQRFLRDVNAACLQDSASTDRDADVVALVTAPKRRRSRRAASRPLETAAFFSAAVLRISRSASGGQRTDHERDAWLDDPGLLARDRCQRPAEQRLVIQVNRRDRGRQRLDDVGGVEASAQAGLRSRRFGPPGIANRTNAAAVAHSKNVGENSGSVCCRSSTPLRTLVTAVASEPVSTDAPSMTNRSSSRSRCGDVYRADRWPAR